jgi:hypothetical protein
MENKYRTPRIDSQNIVQFTCSDDAIEVVLAILKNLEFNGIAGRTIDIEIDEQNLVFDGDGRDKVSNIAINGYSLQEWEKEWDRLEKCKIKTQEKLSEIDEIFPDNDENQNDY